MKKLKIGNVVLCEGIRHEIGGKHTLVGVFAPEINIAQFPGVVPIAIWVALLPPEVGDYEAEFRARDSGKNELVKGQMKIGIQVAAHTALALGPVPLQIKEPGDFIFEWSVEGGRWDKIAVLRVNQVGVVPDAVAALVVQAQT